MFIGVGSYKTKRSLTDDINVFDTEDCTVETVSVTELYESGVRVSNLDFFLVGGVYSACVQSLSFLSSLPSENVRTRGFSYDYKTGMFIVQGTKFWVNDMQYSYVNDTRLKNNTSMLLSYMFRWRDYIILRYVEVVYRRDNKVPFWYSVAIERGSGEIIAEWIDDYSEICTDRALAMQVDMTSEV